MGDLQPWPVQSNGHLSESIPESLLHQYPPNPDPATIDEAKWQRAEEAAQEVIRHVHPTVASEKNRKAVIDFVKGIVMHWNGAVVFPFGSVPLKTYLPDGDIDLTALASSNSEHVLPDNVWTVLHAEEVKCNAMLEEGKSNAGFEVKDVQLICAEVKLVKCLVQNIVVDISFNQVGGLYTLCFLQEVDGLIGKDHLFKRSIMLIKSWCYYESRILGAHHGLISTYALETLILYIFNLFHKTLDSPLVVLYRFLDYYSKFDWENLGISVHGPISLASLPEIVVKAEVPEVPASDLLLQEDFLNGCLERYQVKVPNRPNDVRSFHRKNLNIVDPLKPTNNLGRSVSRSNFFRIRSAFVFGARKLSQILSLPADSIPDEVSTFFRNTLERHGSGSRRPDVSDQTSTSPYADINSPFGQMLMQYHNGINPHYGQFVYPPQSLPPMFAHEENIKGLGGCEPDSSDSGSASPSEGPSEPDGLADLTGNNDENVNNLSITLKFFENKQLDSSMLPRQPVGLDSSPVFPLTYGLPLMGGGFARRGLNGHAGVHGPPFPSGPMDYYVIFPQMIPPSGSHYVTDDSAKTRGTGTYLPLLHQRQQHQQQQQYRDRVHPRSRSRNSVRQDQAGTMTELVSDEEPIFNSPSAQVYRPPPPPPLHLPYRVPNERRVPRSPIMDIPQSPQLSNRGNRGGGSGPPFPQEQQVEFGTLGSVVLPTPDRNYSVGVRPPPPPPPLPSVPAVVQVGQRSSSAGPLHGNRSSMTPNRSKRNNQTYKLKDKGDFPPLSG